VFIIRCIGANKQADEIITQAERSVEDGVGTSLEMMRSLVT
jgi:hypothetical protein